MLRARSEGDLESTLRVNIVFRTAQENLNRGLDLTRAELEELFGVKGTLVFFREPFDAMGRPQADAYASSAQLRPGTDGSVLMGFGMLASLLQGDPDGMALAAILAHEFGHILQYADGMKLYRMLREPGDRPILVELHADFMCGYFMATRKRLRFPELNINHLGPLYSLLGDDYVGAYLDHGTVEQRMRAVGTGYRQGMERGIGTSIEHIAHAGAEFVNGLVRG